MNKNDKLTPQSSIEDEAVSESSAKAKSSKKRGRFNVIDFLLILVVLAVVAIALIYLLPGITEKMSSNTSDITYVVEFRGVEEEFIANIQVGDVVYDAGQNYMIGYVKAVATDSYSTLVYDEITSSAVMKEHPSLKTLIVTISSTALYTEGDGYSVNGERIAVGRKYDMRLPNFKGSCYCVQIETSNK